MSFDPAKARLEVDVVAGLSAATAVWASNPMKLLIPHPRGDSVWASVGTYGGGFVAGDETSLDIRLGAGAACFVTTQASTKIYRNPRSRPCGHTLRAKLAADSLLVLAPDPIQSFAGSSYYQHQEFTMDTGANLILVDSYTSGRAARDERWSFAELRSHNEVVYGDERLLVDSLFLTQSHGPLDGPGRMGRFNGVALLVLVGPMMASSATQILAEVEALPVTPRAELVISASPVRHGAIVRLAGERTEDVAKGVRKFLGFVPELLGDDPWARKW